VRNIVRAGLIAVAFLGAACSRPEVPVMDVPAGWTELRAGNAFTLYGPPGTILHQQQGADSVVGRFDGPNFYMTFDYGGSSNPLTAESSDRNYSVEHFGIGGQLVQFVVGPSEGQDGCGESKEVAAMSMRGLGRTQAALTILACMDSSSRTGTIRAMVRTIRFPN